MNFTLPEDRLHAEGFPTVKDAIGCIINAIKTIEADEAPTQTEQPEPEEISQEGNRALDQAEEIPPPSRRKPRKPARHS